ELASLNRPGGVVAEIFAGIVHLRGAAADYDDRRILRREGLHKARLRSKIFRKDICPGLEIGERIRAQLVGGRTWIVGERGGHQMNRRAGGCSAVELDYPSGKTGIAGIIFSIGGEIIEFSAFDRSRRIVSKILAGEVYL